MIIVTVQNSKVPIQQVVDFVHTVRLFVVLFLENTENQNEGLERYGEVVSLLYSPNVQEQELLFSSFIHLVSEVQKLDDPKGWVKNPAILFNFVN